LGLHIPFPVFLLCDLGAFAGDILLGPHRFNAQNHIKISRKGAEAQRETHGRALPRLPQYPGLDQVVVPLPPSLQGAGTVKVLVTANGYTSNAISLTFQ